MIRSIFLIFVFITVFTGQFPLAAMDEGGSDNDTKLLKRKDSRRTAHAPKPEAFVPPTPASSPVPQKKGPTVFPPPLQALVGKGPFQQQVSPIQTSSPTTVDLPGLMLLGLGSRPVGDTPRNSGIERRDHERPMAPFPGMDYAGDDADGEAIFSPRTLFMVAGQETTQAVKPPYRRRRSAAYHVPPLPAPTVVTQEAGLETDGDE
jgi:hypothetical protein